MQPWVSPGYKLVKGVDHVSVCAQWLYSSKGEVHLEPGEAYHRSVSRHERERHILFGGSVWISVSRMGYFVREVTCWTSQRNKKLWKRGKTVVSCVPHSGSRGGEKTGKVSDCGVALPLGTAAFCVCHHGWKCQFRGIFNFRYDLQQNLYYEECLSTTVVTRLAMRHFTLSS